MKLHACMACIMSIKQSNPFSTQQTHLTGKRKKDTQKFLMVLSCFLLFRLTSSCSSSPILTSVCTKVLPSPCLVYRRPEFEKCCNCNRKKKSHITFFIKLALSLSNWALVVAHALLLSESHSLLDRPHELAVERLIRLVWRQIKTVEASMRFGQLRLLA